MYAKRVTTLSRESAVRALTTVFGDKALREEPWLPDVLVKHGVRSVTLDRALQDKISDALRREAR